MCFFNMLIKILRSRLNYVDLFSSINHVICALSAMKSGNKENYLDLVLNFFSKVLLFKNG